MLYNINLKFIFEINRYIKNTKMMSNIADRNPDARWFSSGNSSGISKKGNNINPCVTIKCQAFYFRVNIFLFFKI